jgi:predicted ATPase
MNNYRGFSQTLIPVESCNFLVGENSTGKSSFLYLLQLVTRPEFWFHPSLSIRNESSLGAFDDIVSAWASDRTYVDVGVVLTRKTKSGKTELSLAVHRFKEKDANPALACHVQRHDGYERLVLFGARKARYLTAERPSQFDSEQAAIAAVPGALKALDDEPVGLKTFPKGMPPDPPLAVALSLLRNVEKGEKPSSRDLRLEIPLAMNVAWIAPIRTRPKRIYDSLSREYSAEGEHSPFVLKQQLRSQRFFQKLAAFGKSSGLYEAVATHTFGRGAQNPFEVLVAFKGAQLNISNVGYGVSQVLPLVVEFLSAEAPRTFAVQQPEVHLHPKAQAALGDLIFEVVRERKHTFLIETHSDYLIDRYRLAMAKHKSPPRSQVIFFSRSDSGNRAELIEISEEGRYPSEQPTQFKDFFIKEEMRLLSI